jgi:hypothetical protein
MEKDQPQSPNNIPAKPDSLTTSTDLWIDKPILDPVTSAHRLVVVIPNGKIDYSQLAQKIWRMASFGRKNVLYVGCLNDKADQMAITRQIVTIAAITRDPQVSVGFKLVTGPDWAAALKAILKPGDEITVLDEHVVSTGWFKQTPFSEIIKPLNFPVQILSGLLKPQPLFSSLYESSFLHQVILWILLIITFFGFFEFDSLIDSSIKGWPAVLILILLVSLEIGVIWFWNSILG